MFFIMGVSQNQKKLDFKQLNVCKKCCGKYSNIEVYMTYWYFMFFFIPIIKWNKEYYIKTSVDIQLKKILYIVQSVQINYKILKSKFF